MKNNFVLIVVFLQSFLVFSQDKTTIDLLIAEASWGKEIIQMPLHFAAEIPYKGMEEIRFSPDWSKQNADGFWSYAFVWDIDLNKELTATDVETDLQYYFDGLMNVVNKDKGKVLPKTIALFLKKENDAEVSEFIGKLQVYNSFHTKDIMILYCTVKQYYCKEKKKSMVLFRFSPKAFGQSIWQQLETVQLRKKPCED